MHAEAEADRLEGNALEIVKAENKSVPCAQSRDFPSDRFCQHGTPTGIQTLLWCVARRWGTGQRGCFFLELIQRDLSARSPEAVNGRVRYRSPQPG